jgi:predicted nucleic acid-binding protein
MIRTDMNFVAPDFMILEVTSAVAHQLGASIADSTIFYLRSIQRMQYYPLDDELLKRSLDVAITLRLRGGDCIYVALAEQLNLPLVTWDKEILEKASSRVRVWQPA